MTTIVEQSKQARYKRDMEKEEVRRKVILRDLDKYFELVSEIDLDMIDPNRYLFHGVLLSALFPSSTSWERVAYYWTGVVWQRLNPYLDDVRVFESAEEALKVADVILKTEGEE